jgi:phenylpropionate dioxygenase-like ring-hydroxylating dioxygenase large terminal subunit
MAFSREENEALTRVGRGTLMGELFRQYWIPVLATDLLRAAGGPPRRIRLLGEDLVLFRTRGGEPGLVGAYCQHRLAPLFFGRIEQDGIRCPYHGWKYGVDGKCLEMPNVPPEQEFKNDVHHPGYPCLERAGFIWTYMGPAKQLPPLPEFEFLMVPEEQQTNRAFRSECNYLQAMEGGIDPTHPVWLHSPYNLDDDELAQAHQPDQHRIANQTGARTPELIEIVDTPGGFMYGAKRPMKDGNGLWRINQFIMPFYTMPPGGDQKAARMWVPIDDEHCVKWQLNWYSTRQAMESAKEKSRVWREEEMYAPATNEPYGFIIPKANKSNDYLIDWKLHTTRRMGVAGVNLQDVCVTENEGPTPILDRTKENLCSGDRSIMKARQMLLRAAKELKEQGKIPPGARDASVYHVRGAAKIIPESIPWAEAAKRDVYVATSQLF